MCIRDRNKDITITTTPSVNVAFTATLALSAGLVQAAKPWTQTVFAGTAITAPDPVFTDNAGVGAAENVKLTQTDGITFTVDYDTPANAANNTWGHSAAVSYTSGVANVSIPAGQAVRVTATAATGYILTNADATDPTQKTHIVTYNFTDGAFATPAAPTKADMPGSDNDTYTINGTTGVDYYVNGVKFDAAKFNLPQSTGGASSLTITAQAQSGFAIATGANTSWTLEYGSTVGTPTVDHDITSVSYTNLDVYKRQHRRRLCLEEDGYDSHYGCGRSWRGDRNRAIHHHRQRPRQDPPLLGSG